MKQIITRPVWVEVDLEKIRFNVRQIKKVVSQETMIMAIVKADAYGHGVIPVAKAVIDAGVDRLGVALPEEGVELREAGFKLPIQVLGETLPSQAFYYIDYDLIPSISKLETAREINAIAGKKGIVKKVHLLIDTGMGRIGVLPDQALEFIEEVRKLPNLEIEGLVTHFSKADEGDREYTKQQWDKFNGIIQRLAEKKIYIPIKQAANSAAIIDFPELELDMVRPGIMIYGLQPSHKVGQNFPLQAALSWKARVVYLKEVPPGYGISYGATYITKRETKVATIPLGYADGFSRHLSNKGEVLIKGRRAAVIGTVCMDQFMVDVTHIPDVKVGDEVVLIGRQGKEEITATEMADKIGTINYEITCTISKRVPRIYHNEM